MFNKIKVLEQRVEDIIALCRALAKENKELKVKLNNSSDQTSSTASIIQAKEKLTRIIKDIKKHD